MAKVELSPVQMGFKKSSNIVLELDKDHEIQVNGVVGLNSEGEYPARLGSGLLAVFTTAETIHERASRKLKDPQAPTTRIIIPRNISQYVNQIPEDLVRQQIDQGTHVIQQLAKNHFKNIDLLLDEDQPITPEALTVLGEIAKMATTIDPAILRKITESGRRRAADIGEQNAITYASEHLFGWSDLFHVARVAYEPPFMVINGLTPAEDTYQKFRHAMLEKLQEDPQFAPMIRTHKGNRFDLVTVMSNRPHYLFITDSNGRISEPSLSDAKKLTCGEVLQEYDENLRRMELETDTTDKDIFNKQRAAITDLKRAKEDFGRLVDKLARGRTDAKDAKLEELLASAA